jgi:hypothetical protein
LVSQQPWPGWPWPPIGRASFWSHPIRNQLANFLFIFCFKSIRSRRMARSAHSVLHHTALHCTALHECAWHCKLHGDYSALSFDNCTGLGASSAVPMAGGRIVEATL